MHYIIGTSFSIPTQQERAVRPATGATQLNRQSVKQMAREWTEFEQGHSYTLYHIQKATSGKIQYTFRSDTGAAELVKEFDSSGEGDQFISNVRCEPLPDYTSFYENRND